MSRYAAVASIAVLLLASTGCAAQPVPGTPAPAAGAKPAPTTDIIVWEATGSDPAHDGGQNTTTEYSLVGHDGDPRNQLGFGYPFAATNNVPHQAQRSLWLMTVGGQETVTCSITVNGTVVATATAFGETTCTWSGHT